MKENLEKLKESIAEIQAARKEIEAATRLLWAAAHINGGEIRIPDAVLKLVEGGQELICCYDHITNETVIKSQFKVPSILPGKV